ncbi:MAG: prevent-host-death protein [Phenylobacterium sp. RIFCSPHIGHO2_01_FULL_70_10]|mgnify:CR=1 FL=1|nr:MAG: prevent-host-death protein [Phenylobacterium sp. RIFCSPHIGHO2_01_FULL_70_10]
MRIPVSDAKAQLTELVRRAEAGDEVILTRHGQAAVRLIPVRSAGDPASRRRVLDRLRRAASRKAVQGASAARSQDFLYDDQGLPE